ncbi:MAG TPA: ATP-binding protein, partial [Blastocatellia bacterium]|nr:ATP-binding protein [Blastocatellia bacterium]
PMAPLEIEVESLLAHLDDYAEDFREVRGQAHAKRAIEVATAGAHNIILLCPERRVTPWLVRALLL